MTFRLDDVAVGSVEYELGNPGQYLPAGEIGLDAGQTELRITQGGGDLRPGNGGARAGLRQFGPVVFSPPENEQPRILTRPPRDWRSLCGRRLDWIEVLAKGA